MKWALAILFCLGALFSAAQVLNRKVNLDARNITVEEALQQINRTYGIKFSYSNNLLPVKKLNLQLKDTPLSQVLDKVLSGTGLTYQQVGEQIVIKKSTSKKSTGSSNAIPQQNQSGYRIDSLQHHEMTASTEMEVLPQIPSPQLQEAYYQTAEDLDEAYRTERHRMRRDYEQKMDSIHTLEGRKTFKHKWKTSMAKLHLQYLEAKDSMEVSWKGFKERRAIELKAVQDTLRARKVRDSLAKEQSLNDTIPSDNTEEAVAADTNGYKKDNFQFTVVPPLGTHGDEAPQYINDFSVNLFAGYNGGSRYLEAALIANVTKSSITGFQFAGVTNVVKEDMKGIQVAVVNVVGGQVQGVQLSYIASICKEDMWGVQLANIACVAGDTVNGAQISTIVNYTPACVYGLQASYIVNVCRGGLYGIQAGMVNTAKYTNGVQVGLVNSGGRVRGVQVGFLNFADSIQGLPIGFLSFVRKGYHHPELYYGETMTANLAFKTGVRAFYNILCVGYQWEPDGYFRWSLGYGLGSEIKMGKRFALNLDVLAMHINENTGFSDDGNFLGQFRMNFCYGFSRTIYLFAGPTFNTMLSSYVQKDGTVGSALIPQKNLIWETTYTGGAGHPTKAAMWIGFNAGIRF